MNRFLRTMIILGVLVGFLSSCKVFNPSVMLRTKRNHPYAQATDTVPKEYTLQPGDIITFRLYSNQGFKIIDLSTFEEGNRGIQQLNQQNLFPYRIEADSAVNLPILGRINVGGMNLKEAELMLEDRYSDYYNEPFVMLQVTNRRIIVYPGAGGSAQVVSMTNEYMTIVEALAQAGGLSERAKAHKIRVIRGSLKDPEVFKIDLSTTEGLAEANLHYVRANDIIYVEPSYFVGRQILTTTGQILALLTNSIATYLIVTNFVTN